MFFQQWISITLCSIQMHPLNMDTISGTSEIVETMEELYSDMKIDEHVGKRRMLKLKPGQICSIEDDINKLFEAIDTRTTGRNLGLLERVGKDSLRKNAMKRPMRSGSSQSSGIQIAESVKLKQALRGLCLSQASEMATMKRLSKQADSSRSSEAETIKRLYRAVVHEASESSLPIDEGKGNSVHISLVPERSTSNFSEKTSESGKLPKQERLQQHARSSTLLVDESATPEERMIKIPPADEIVPFSTHGGSEISMLELGWNGKPKLMHSSPVFHTKEKLPVLDEIIPATAEFPKSLERVKEQKDKLHFASSLLRDKNASNNVIKSANSSRHVMRSVFRNKNFVKKKAKQDSTSIPCDGGVDHVLAPSMNKMVSKGPKCTLGYGKTEKDIPSPSSSIANVISEVRSTAKDLDPDKPVLTSSIGNRTRATILKADEKSRSREKGDISQSSKSSIGEYSSSTSHSEESTLSGSSRSGNRPHMSKDLRWEAIRHVQKQHGSVGLRHFKLLMKLGSGDIGTVYLAELTGTNCLFALKMMNSEFLDCKKKLHRAQTEREILQMLDHPFLPTLFTHFTTDRFACLVMEHCPGGDLHVLRQKQPNKSFSEQAARFYVAEVLLALEYLHMLGVVYRDLKPENILVRDDGHIMLTDFDLSLRCAAVNPTLLKSSPVIESPKRESPSPCTEASCIHPFCLQPSWQVPCFTPRLLSTAAKTRMLKPDLAAQMTPLPQLVAEPTTARSNSFVGTHEYLAPEIIKGEGHGSAVDWWTFGIFLYELLYGKTPFKGPASEDTLLNVVSRSLKFPSIPSVGSYTRDLIRGLLVKEPENRLGSVKGAAEIMRHPFFEGLNWALIRCAIPPEIPRVCDYVNFSVDMSFQKMESARCPEVCKSIGENMEFEMF